MITEENIALADKLTRIDGEIHRALTLLVSPNSEELRSRLLELVAMLRLQRAEV